MLAANAHLSDSMDWKEIAVASVLILMVAYLALGADILGGEIVAPMDALMEAKGWSGLGLNLPVTSHLRGDILDAWLPRWIFTKKSLYEGEIPLWNPLVAGGQPALPLLPDSYLTPSFLLFCLFDDGFGFTLALLVRLWLAGMGTYLLCRTALGRMASFFAGMTFMMCGFNLSWLMWPQVATSAWIPWVLWATLRLFEKPGLVRMTWLAMLGTFLMLGGFPAVACYGLFLTAGVSLWQLSGLVSSRGLLPSLKLLFWLGGALLLILPLAAIQLLPFWEYLRHVELSWRAGWGIPISKALLLLFPFKEGEPHPEYCGYVGIAATVLTFISIFWAFRTKKLGGPFSPFFWAAAAALTLAIVYGQPEPLVAQLYRLPVLNFNQNGRMLSLFGLEMSILAGVGLQFLIGLLVSRLERIGRRSHVFVSLASLLLLFSVQFLDLQRISRSQNAVVPRESFFPSTALIKKVQRSLLPGQSIIHTYDSFRHPGVMTVYGLKDWFAHTHRLPNEKESLRHLVQNPWTGPTAATIFPEEIKLESRYFDVFSVRYVFVSAPAVAGFSRPDSHVLLRPGEIVSQSITVDLSSLVTGVQVLTAAYGPGGEPDCGLRAVLRRMDEKQIAAMSIPKEQVQHNRWTTILFEEEHHLEPGSYLLELEALAASPVKPLVIGASPNSDQYLPGSMRTATGIGSGDLAFRLLGIQLSRREKWKISQFDGPVTMFENCEVPAGGFLVGSKSGSEIADMPEIWWEGLRVLKRDRERIDYELTCEENCWQVQSDRYWPGWNAYVDGVPVPVERIMGLFPAVFVPAGTHGVSWKYEPTPWSHGWKISLFTLFVLLALQFVALVNAGLSQRSPDSPGTSTG